MRILPLPLLLPASLLSGVSAIFEKLSVVDLSDLTVLTLRYSPKLPVLWAALFASGRYCEPATIAPQTFAHILIPATMALGSPWSGRSQPRSVGRPTPAEHHLS